MREQLEASQRIRRKNGRQKRSLVLTWDRTSEPTAVVEGGKATTPLWGSDFNDVGRSSAGHDGYTETENETTSDELFLVVGRGDDCRSTVRRGNRVSTVLSTNQSRRKARALERASVERSMGSIERGEEGRNVIAAPVRNGGMTLTCR
jgi:hypothetical protein